MKRITNLRHHVFTNTNARIVALLAICYAIYYLWWRTFHSLNPAALWLAIPLLLVELYGVMNFGLFLFMTWDQKLILPPSPPKGHTVDIFIATYNEDLSILRLTILGAVNVRYPHETWVLDDGRRPELRRLCNEMGVHYLTRSDNQHFKAGNINAALAQTSGEFIAMFDADVVPLPDFIDHTLGYFNDEQVAFVQTQQEYYNIDSVQHTANLPDGQTWHEQSLFFKVIQNGKNRWNAAFWCGSNSIMRRTALLSVGGIATGTVTEDIHTSLRLHAKGWKSVYHNELLSLGLAPKDYLAFTVQRLRWAQGAMQVLRRENPLFKPGLTLAQRLNYLSSMITYFESFQRLVYILAPSIVLITATLPIHAGMLAFVLRFVPYFILGNLANMALSQGNFRFFETERYNLLKMVTFIKASLTLVVPHWGPKAFQVTPKGASNGKGVPASLMWPYYVLLIVILISMVIGGFHIFGVFGSRGVDKTALLISEGWAIFNLSILIGAIRVIWRHITQRSVYRFPVAVPVYVHLAGRMLSGLTTNLHQQGLSLLLSEQLMVGTTVHVELHLPNKIVQGNVVIRASHHQDEADDQSFWYNSGPFAPATAAGADEINEFLISIMTNQMQPNKDLAKAA